jgi:hypothetical protein
MKEVVTEQSAQPCGCDPGVPYVCAPHLNGAWPLKRSTVPLPDSAYSGPWPMSDRERYYGSSPASPDAPGMPEPSTPECIPILPTTPAARKTYPVATGVLDYFPDAIVAVAHVSYVGNAQHNPGQPLHWAREKSTDQEDTMLRHYLERGTLDTDGCRHTAKMVWRALAMLQLEIERERHQ